MVSADSSACYQCCAPRIEVRSQHRQRQCSLALLNACPSNITSDDTSSGVAVQLVCRWSVLKQRIRLFCQRLSYLCSLSFRCSLERWWLRHLIRKFSDDTKCLIGFLLETIQLYICTCTHWKHLPFIWGILLHTVSCSFYMKNKTKHGLYSILYSRKQLLCHNFTFAQTKIKILHWLLQCGLSRAAENTNAPLKSPSYIVSIQLPGYTLSRHKATIVLIVFWDKYSASC